MRFQSTRESRHTPKADVIQHVAKIRVRSPVFCSIGCRMGMHTNRMRQSDLYCMPYLYSMLLKTYNWSPYAHVPHRSPAILISKRWFLPSAPCTASKSRVDKVIKRENDRNVFRPPCSLFDSSAIDSCWPYKVYMSHRVTDRKSAFQAHATHLPAATLMSAFLDHLTSLPCLKRATCCMYAYRSTQRAQEQEKLACGQSDGGESGSGDRLSRLLELSNCHNVVVVVFRWYGGTKLGSDRWKRISEVAKEALNQGGFMKQGALQHKKPNKLTKH